MRSLSRLAFALIALSASLSANAAESAANSLRQGTLPNGMRYAVVPHAASDGEVSLRLVVRAGSLDERDDERGFAHLVEHMGFNGTRTFPSGTIRYFFENLGLKFGADLNASTSFTHTIYKLDLPQGKADRLDEALIVLRDFADGMLFQTQEVAQERSVVLSELRTRDSEARRIAVELIDTVYAGTRLPEREVSGLVEQIQQATPESLRAFYQRNYAPARMLVIVAGAIDPDATIARIAEVFARMAGASGSVAPAPNPAPPKPGGIKPAVIAIPSAKGMSVQFVAVDERPPDTPEGHRQELIQRVATGILHNRLAARREGQGGRFGPTRASYSNGPVGSLVHHIVSISSTADDWTAAVSLLESELRRARVEGLTQAEVDEAAAAETARVSAARTVSAATVANDLARLLAADRGWALPEAAAAEATHALKGITAEEATQELQRIFPENALHVILTVPEDRAVKPERLLAAYTASTERRLRESSEDEPLVFNYTDFGRPGAISSRTTVDDLGLTLVSFANGVRLNVRPSEFEPGRFRLRIVFPANYSDVPQELGGVGELAGELMLHNNLRRHKLSELIRLMKLHGVNPQFAVNHGTPILSMNGPQHELTFAFQLVTALLSDLQFDAEHYGMGISFYAGRRRSLFNSSALLARHLAFSQFLGGDARVMMNPPEVFARTPPSAAENWLRSRILQGPLEIGLVGDVAVEEAITTAARTVGTLKNRAAPPRRGAPMKVTTKSVRNRTRSEQADSNAVACVLWPVTLPDDPRHHAALSLVVDAFRDRLLLALRESLGAAYSPQLFVHRDLVQRDIAYVGLSNSLEPARTQQYTEGCIKLAAILAERGLSETEFARVREPARTSHAERLRNNGWWLNEIVSAAQSRPAVLEEARIQEKLLDEITLAEVNEAAKVFRPEIVSVMIVMPQEPSP